MLGQELTPDGAGFVDTWTDVFYDDDGGVVLSSYFNSPPKLQAPSGPKLHIPHGVSVYKLPRKREVPPGRLEGRGNSY